MDELKILNDLRADSVQDLTDMNFFQKGFNGTLFPGINSNAQGHEGFLGQYSETANTILPEVKRLISSKGATTVWPCVFSHLGLAAMPA